MFRARTQTGRPTQQLVKGLRGAAVQPEVKEPMGNPRSSVKIRMEFSEQLMAGWWFFYHPSEKYDKVNWDD